MGGGAKFFFAIRYKNRGHVPLYRPRVAGEVYFFPYLLKMVSYRLVSVVFVNETGITPSNQSP